MGSKNKDRFLMILLVLFLLAAFGWACWHFGYKQGRQNLINRIYNDPMPLFRDLEKKGIINNNGRIKNVK